MDLIGLIATRLVVDIMKVLEQTLMTGVVAAIRVHMYASLKPPRSLNIDIVAVAFQDG